jgi:hypothetical protein
VFAGGTLHYVKTPVISGRWAGSKAISCARLATPYKTGRRPLFKYPFHSKTTDRGSGT